MVRMSMLLMVAMAMVSSPALAVRTDTEDGLGNDLVSDLKTEDPEDDDLLTLTKPEKGVVRSEEDAEKLATAIGMDLIHLTEDEQEDVVQAINLIDMDFDIIDEDGGGDIEAAEFTNFFIKNLDVPENKRPNGKQAFVLNPVAVNKLFTTTAGEDDKIDKNEFAKMILNHAQFRKVTFFLIYPAKEYSLMDPGSWKKITLEMFQVFLGRNGVTAGAFMDTCVGIFTAIAGPDKLLEFGELESAIEHTKRGSLLQQSSQDIIDDEMLLLVNKA